MVSAGDGLHGVKERVKLVKMSSQTTRGAYPYARSGQNGAIQWGAAGFGNSGCQFTSTQMWSPWVTGVWNVDTYSLRKALGAARQCAEATKPAADAAVGDADTYS